MCAEHEEIEDVDGLRLWSSTRVNPRYTDIAWRVTTTVTHDSLGVNMSMPTCPGVAMYAIATSRHIQKAKTRQLL